MCGHKTVGLCFSIKTNKVKTRLVNFFFFGDKPIMTNYGEKKMCCFYCNFAKRFFIGFGFFYILTYYFYQILGNAPLIVKIHRKNTLFLSTITKQYFFFTEFSTSIKHINKISNYTII